MSPAAVERHLGHGCRPGPRPLEEDPFPLAQASARPDRPDRPRGPPPRPAALRHGGWQRRLRVHRAPLAARSDRAAVGPCSAPGPCPEENHPEGWHRRAARRHPGAHPPPHRGREPPELFGQAQGPRPAVPRPDRRGGQLGVDLGGEARALQRDHHRPPQQDHHPPAGGWPGRSGRSRLRRPGRRPRRPGDRHRPPGESRPSAHRRPEGGEPVGQPRASGERARLRRPEVIPGTSATLIYVCDERYSCPLPLVESALSAVLLRRK